MALLSNRVGKGVVIVEANLVVHSLALFPGNVLEYILSL